MAVLASSYGFIHRIPKHLQKRRLHKRIQLRNGFASLGAQGVCGVEDLGDAFLFGEGWEWDLEVRPLRTVRDTPVISEFRLSWRYPVADESDLNLVNEGIIVGSPESQII